MGFKPSRMTFRNYWQNDGGRIIRLVENSLAGFVHLRRQTRRQQGVQVSIESREIAARDFQADPMVSLEDVTGYTSIDVDLVRLVLRDEYRLGERKAIAKSLQAIRYYKRGPIRLNVYQLCCKVRIVG
jgi:hypothetical protein